MIIQPFNNSRSDKSTVHYDNLVISISFRNDDLTNFLRQIDELQGGTSADHQDAYNLLINKTNQVLE